MDILHLAWDLFLLTLTLGGTLLTLIGIVTVVQWARTPKMPADDSNRINNIKSWWIGLTRPEVMAAAYHAFKQDELDNLEDVNKAHSKSE